LASSYFQAEEKKKNHKEEKNAEKGGSFPSNSRSTLSLLAPTSTLLFQTLSLSIFFFSSIRKGKKEKKKTIEKKCREGRELSFKLLFYPFTFGSCFCPFVSNTFSWHFLLLK